MCSSDLISGYQGENPVEEGGAVRTYVRSAGVCVIGFEWADHMGSELVVDNRCSP